MPFNIFQGPGPGNMDVDVYVSDNSVSPVPISDAVVNIFDPITFALLGTALTDDTGRAAFTLFGSPTPGTAYEVRAFKVGVIFANPFAISVLNPLAPHQSNRFDISGTLLTLPVSTDPACCRCTGRFFDQQNRPMANRTVRIISVPLPLDQSGSGPERHNTKWPTPRWPTPKVAFGNMVASEAIEVKTDPTGSVSVNLLQGGKYDVCFAGEEDVVWPITVPARTSVNLIDLIHPQPVTLTWGDVLNPPGPVGTGNYIDNTTVWAFIRTLPPALAGWKPGNPYPSGDAIKVAGNIWGNLAPLTSGSKMPLGLAALNPAPGTLVSDNGGQWLLISPWMPNWQVFAGDDGISSICYFGANVYLCMQDGFTYQGLHIGGGPIGMDSGIEDNTAEWDFEIVLPSPLPEWTPSTYYPPTVALSGFISVFGNFWATYGGFTSGNTGVPPGLGASNPPPGTTVVDNGGLWLLISPWTPNWDVTSGVVPSLCYNYGNVYKCSADGKTGPGSLTLDMSVGQSIEVPFTVLFSDYRSWTPDQQDMWTRLAVASLDTYLVEACKTGHGVSLTALLPGETQVEVTATQDQEPPRVPPYSINAPTLSIVVFE